jgi:peptide/nickel transport system substrate-binding protein
VLWSPSRRLPGWLAIVAVATVLSAACDGSDNGSADSHGSTDSGAAITGIDAARQPPAAEVEGAVAGGTVTVVEESPIGAPSMDPTRGANYQLPAAIFSGLVTRSLTQYVYDPDLGTMVLVPDIATDIGTPNADFTEWTYTIRPGVKFEDGTEVTAQDVAYGIERSFDDVDFGDAPPISHQYFLDGNDYHGPSQTGTHYDGVVVDGDTLTLKMARPFPDMPYWAASPAISPIPPLPASNPATYWQHPMATGPYKFDGDFSAGQPLTLVRNDYWDPATDPGRHQYPDRYVFRSGVSPDRAAAMILGDSVAGQRALSLDNMPDSEFARAQELGRVSVEPGFGTKMWMLDLKRIRDIRVREAIGYAYPYRGDARANGLIPGVTQRSGTSVIPPGLPGRLDYTVLDTQPGQTDPARARNLLRDASAIGYELRWPYRTDDPVSVAMTHAMIAAFDAAGFKPVPFPTTEDNWFAVDVSPDAPLDMRSVNVWYPDFPESAGGWIRGYFETGGPGNFASFAEPDVDAEIQRIAAIPIEQQPAAWGALDKTIMTKYYPAIVTKYAGSAFLHGSKIGGMNIESVQGMPTFKDIYVGRQG